MKCLTSCTREHNVFVWQLQQDQACRSYLFSYQLQPLSQEGSWSFLGVSESCYSTCLWSSVPLKFMPLGCLPCYPPTFCTLTSTDWSLWSKMHNLLLYSGLALPGNWNPYMCDPTAPLPLTCWTPITLAVNTSEHTSTR